MPGPVEGTDICNHRVDSARVDLVMMADASSTTQSNSMTMGDAFGGSIGAGYMYDHFALLCSLEFPRLVGSPRPAVTLE